MVFGVIRCKSSIDDCEGAQQAVSDIGRRYEMGEEEVRADAMKHEIEKVVGQSKIRVTSRLIFLEGISFDWVDKGRRETVHLGISSHTRTTGGGDLERTRCEANARSESVMLLKRQLFKRGQGGLIGRRLVTCYCMRAEVHKELKKCGDNTGMIEMNDVTAYCQGSFTHCRDR
eukprot:scaffold17853_cov65-Cyclotella_meneghiniana.AAC.5